MPSPNVISWNVIISAHVKCGQEHEGLDQFHQMQQEGWWPNPATFLAVLNSCASIGALEEGMHAHEQIIQSHYDSIVHVANSHIDIYANVIVHQAALRRCGSWTVMIWGHVMIWKDKCNRNEYNQTLSFLCRSSMHVAVY